MRSILTFEVLGVLLWVCYFHWTGTCVSLAHPPEVSVVPAASLRRPWSISAAHVTQRTDTCCLFCWVGILAVPTSVNLTLDDRMKGQTPRDTRWHSSSSSSSFAARQLQPLPLCLRRLLSVAGLQPGWGATTTIVDLLGRRHRSIAPTRNNNPASQPNHIRIAQRANRILGRRGAERGIPDRVRGTKGTEGTVHPDASTLSHDVQQSLSQPAGMVWFGMPSGSDSCGGNSFRRHHDVGLVWRGGGGGRSLPQAG